MSCIPCQKAKKKLQAEQKKTKKSTLIDSVVSLGEAVVDVITRGEDAEVCDETFQNRINICLNCPFYMGGKFKMCTDCKCFVYKKCRLKIAECPQSKWSKSEI